MILDKVGYSYQDLTIIPTKVSSINSRSECNPFIDANFMLPIFAAPMTSVCNEKNYRKFYENGITPVIPRSVELETRKQLIQNGEWVAVSLAEFEEMFAKEPYSLSDKKYICIDIANGHMNKLLEIVQRAKIYTPYLHIMAGNIANPEAIFYLNNAGIDYVRVGIGSGNCCITSSNTGIHYPIASLLEECVKIKRAYNLPVQIIADGGVKNYSDVIKALAIGADFVMIGSLFGAMFESAAKWDSKVPDSVQSSLECLSEFDLLQTLKIGDFNKIIYGMASRVAQNEISKSTKTAEGIVKTVRCTTTVKQWTENMKDYLRSTMSYCGARTIYEFIGNQTLIPNFTRAYNQ